MRRYHANGTVPFLDTWREMQCNMLDQPLYAVGQWQSSETDIKTRELMGVVFEYRLPNTSAELTKQIHPNLPWAEDHFQERIGGEPLNPPPSEAWWPFNQNGNKEHKFQKDGEAVAFSHTYPERFWPKYAGEVRGADQISEYGTRFPNRGVRYQLGDLADVVKLLRRAPGTRQAYLPVWFPEDTGTVHGQRVPCSLGYHFLIRGGQLHCWYYMRSCDLLRHFPDDIYMAGRLVQWVCEQLSDLATIRPGILTTTISSLHTFEPDDVRLRRVRALRGCVE